MKKLTRWLLLGWLFVLPAFAQPSFRTPGRVLQVAALPNGVQLTTDSVTLRVVAWNDSVIRVRAVPGRKFPPEFSFAVREPTHKPPAGVGIRQNGKSIELTTPKLVVSIERQPLRIVFRDRSGEVIEEDAAAQPMLWRESGFVVTKRMPEDEHYFGLGDKGGGFDRRNQAFTMWNTDAYSWQESTDPLYKSIPFFLALRHGRSYGIFLDNPYRTFFDFGKRARDQYSLGADGGELNYYFIYGPDPKEVVERFTELTGRTPLPPVWTLGYQQCRYSYYPEARVRELARTFRERRIPADVLYLDIDYQRGNRPFTVDRERFPNFEGMVRDLGAQGFKVVIITDPHLKKEPGYAPYDQGLAGDHFVKNADGSVYVGRVWPGDSVFPDFSREATRRWWGTLYSDFVAMGVKGFWNDMNEPAIFERADKTMPLGVRHRLDGITLDHRAIHNVYGMQNARATYEGLLRLRPDERPFVLTRAAYAGTQRYAASWTGDNSSSWNHLRLTVPTLLSLGISGYAFVGVDVGGFVGSPSPDLLTRWLELGAFLPIDRNHTGKSTADQEPWVHGPEHEAIRRRYIELRYRLLPYLYTSLEETSRTGLPLMRPLFLEYPADEALYEKDEEFLLGRDLLVAPKVTEMPDAYEARLPTGDWYDFWTGKRQPGGQVLKLQPSLESVPIYVRAGAILPQQPVVQHTGEVPQGPLELRVYPGPDCRGSLYLDDGKTFAYQRGEFSRFAFRCAVSAGRVQVSIDAPEGPFPPWWQSISLEIFGIERRPFSLVLGNQTLTQFTYDAARGLLEVQIPQDGQPKQLEVSF